MRRIVLVLLAALGVAAACGGAQPGPEETAVPPDGPYPALIADWLFLYDDSVLSFDVQAFLDEQPGPLKGYSEPVAGEPWTAAETITFNAMLQGLNPQVLLVLLEAQAGLLSEASPAVPLLAAPEGWAGEAPAFYYAVRQLAQTTMAAYDGRRFHEDDVAVAFATGVEWDVPAELNAGTYGTQVGLAAVLPPEGWARWALGDAPEFVTRFTAYFGDSLREPPARTLEALPPRYILPFPVGHVYHITGGPHNYSGGTPGCVAGSGCPRPWSAIDIAPPEPIPCPGGSYPTQRWVVAARSGTVIYSANALVVISHDDGWRTYYSHMAAADRIPVNSWVWQGDLIGHPSCEVEPGGSTTGVHVHFGVWQSGVGRTEIHGSAVSSWVVGETSHYNGTMTRNDEVRTASGGRQGNALSNLPYYDNFNGDTLDAKWHWVREQPSHWSMVNPPGRLRMITQARDLWGPRNSAPVALQTLRPFTGGSFELRGRVIMAPQEIFHQAGLIAYGNDDNYVRLTYIYMSQPMFQLGQEVGGVYQSLEIPAPVGVNDFYLRLVKQGFHYVAYYGLDGVSWSPVGEMTHAPFTVTAVGLTACNAEEATVLEIPAEFGFFHLAPLEHDYRFYLPMAQGG